MSFDELVDHYKQELLQDEEKIEQLEIRMEKRLSSIAPDEMEGRYTQ
ncbi:FbpB family small basic protein [Virgibacillus soli]|uniref:FbpB family small basic protein n=2 Tax=Paracerasibacillus soli TaxID=480284 RepID=A0ABU5CQF4_9BACI|nr:FbpB family small basic protein [Virgibacillus soli]MDY0408042.1 FbpB family small basic protein [Virgibacillus soli]